MANRNYPIILGMKPSNKVAICGQYKGLDGRDLLIYDAEPFDEESTDPKDAKLKYLCTHLHFCSPEVMRKLGQMLIDQANRWEEEHGTEAVE